MDGNEWNDPKDFPDELNPSGNSFSIDVLCYSKRLKIHAIGWFDFQKMKWSFIANEPVKEFKWRYFTENDKPN